MTYFLHLYFVKDNTKGELGAFALLRINYNLSSQTLRESFAAIQSDSMARSGLLVIVGGTEEWLKKSLLVLL